MTNEQIVSEIRNGYSATDYMQSLYEGNLPLIRKFIKPFTAYECEADLLQESYFGLWEAAQHYETSKNVRFMTYAEYWIRQSVQRYLEKCGSTVRIPSYTRQKIARYKKTVQELEQELGRVPTDNEIADKMRVSVRLLAELRIQMQGIASLDTPLADDNSLTLSDTIQADFNLEDETIDKMYAEHSKSQLWGIVERYTSDRENSIIKEIFINNRTMAAVAREQGVTIDRIRQIKEKGLRRLRIGKAKRELLEKFDIVEAGLFRGGLTSYKEHNFTSIVEHLAEKRLEAETRYKRHLAEIEEMHRKRVMGFESVSSRITEREVCNYERNSKILHSRAERCFERV
ncbi:sigma-70 family RNA polymerase sigma factor [Petralouisia muris]|uniref:Sigma-70 family RNA polymerase sigma factor n=1 Tax=Petralouisia muris TaxID=3032872 RepID=A0AC61RYI9_9FIRM|nr:sigma-70 family RNA polymerase sigma factor [Petralouisia muris]TGY96884.1 sigma-70 family RNA polymerase sigma factor [Petralouisia muris]